MLLASAATAREVTSVYNTDEKDVHATNQFFFSEVWHPWIVSELIQVYTYIHELI